METDPTLLRYASTITEQKKCWELLAEKFDRFQTLRNNTQQHPTTCNKVCKRKQHVTSNNVGSCWPTMLRPFARGLIDHRCRPISGREIPQLSLEIVKRAYENKNGDDFCFFSARWCGRVFENSTLLEFFAGLKKKTSVKRLVIAAMGVWPWSPERIWFKVFMLRFVCCYLVHL